MSAVPRASQILLVGQRIRQLRKSRHLTQADLASRIGITQSDLSRMESGEYKVGLDTLFKILHVFELSMSRFFEEVPAPAMPEVESAGGELPEQEQLLADFTQLSDDSRREVREFIAFKRQQAERALHSERLDKVERAVSKHADAASDLATAQQVERLDRIPRPKWPAPAAIGEDPSADSGTPDPNTYPITDPNIK